ncbi:MAG TPA: PorP/SprF family type IX secretion system membrane protein [Bacteroidia bacterium]|nr:PorP/SprF family type IX secretion system membrane protein [Bacteroidia bacterium]HNU33999.1 PorP/SprF family type IX secretion system membrane protein [Bacteroidia bacterium]
MRKLLLTIISAIAVTLATHGQDAHLSQYFNHGILVNPANAGANIQNIRLTGNYRSQWSQISPFKTQSFTFDKRVNKVGFCFLVQKNSAGKTGFTRLKIGGGISYRYAFGDDEEHELAAGLQVGMLQKSFNPDKLTFDTQYQEDIGFDPNAPSYEVFANTKATRPVMNTGVTYSYGVNNADVKIKPFAGVAVSQFNKPKESFIETDNINSIKLSINGGAGITVAEKVEVKPIVMYAKQDVFNELSYGAVTSFAFDNTNTFHVGLFNRNKDAAVIYAGYQLNKLLIGTSYDVNTSEIKGASKGQGGFEISLVYTPQGKKAGKTIKKPKPAEKKNIKPPVKLIPPAFYTIAPALDGKLAEEKTNLQLAGERPEVLPSLQQTKAKEKLIPLDKLIAMENVAAEKASTPVAEKQPEVIREQKAKVKEEITPAQQYDISKLTRVNSVLFSKNTVMFDLNSRFDVVEATIDYMYKYPNSKVLLSGNAETIEVSKKPTLGAMRAQAVREYMMSKGINGERIKTSDNKNLMPVSVEESEVARMMNRRVDIYLLTK